MTDRMRFAILLVAAFLIAAGGPAERVRAEPGGDMKIVAIEGAFEDVSEFVADAIVNRGLVIDYRGYIGRMLKRTGADAGSAKPLYRDAQFFQFCSAVWSRRTMEADPRNIAYCPYVVFVYELAAKSGHRPCRIPAPCTGRIGGIPEGARSGRNAARRHRPRGDGVALSAATFRPLPRCPRPAAG